MAYSIDTSIDIAAPPRRVWELLTDFAAMPKWNPFIRTISGPLREGEKLSVSVGPPGKAPLKFNPKVLVVRPDQELRWLGRLGVPGLFDGEHYFRLEALPDGGTRFHHGERFSGLLVALMGKQLEATRQGFDAMNAALKAEAEGKAE